MLQFFSIIRCWLKLIRDILDLEENPEILNCEFEEFCHANRCFGPFLLRTKEKCFLRASIQVRQHHIQKIKTFKNRNYLCVTHSILTLRTQWFLDNMSYIWYIVFLIVEASSIGAINFIDRQRVILGSA